jgi:hypothetical protein
MMPADRLTTMTTSDINDFENCLQDIPIRAEEETFERETIFVLNEDQFESAQTV